MGAIVSGMPVSPGKSRPVGALGCTVEGVIRKPLNGEAERTRRKVGLVAIELRTAKLRAKTCHMLALCVREVGADCVIVLHSVARVDDGVADVGETLRHDEGRTRRLSPGRRIREPECLRRKARKPLVKDYVILEKTDVARKNCSW